MNAHIFQHEPFEEPFAILDWLTSNQFDVSFTHLYRGDRLPDINRVDWLILMGGGMSINDEARYPWLIEEKQFVRQCIQSGKKVVGVCLGSQLTASSLGCKVYPGKYKEIGWFPIQKQVSSGRYSDLLQASSTVFHWHGETFDLPENAQLLASSKACRNQIFVHGDNVLAMQCHLEMTPQAIEGMFNNCGDEIRPAPFIQTIEEMRKDSLKYAAPANQLLFSLLNSLKG
ncbi:MAG TPA: type 1 glutamine amidotransferase [Bacteroidales bacterium]|nr:type 1 glutamine amidotransferase [Bacteroidales bacterium]